MLDALHINDGSYNRRIFYAGGTGTTYFQTWSKPRNVNFVHFFVLGGGSGGGGGQSSTTGTARRGGGSGASAGFVTGLFSANMLPDTLFINVGAGGAGGAGLTSPTNGASGALSYVMIYPDTGFTATNVVLQSGAAGPTGGVAGTTNPANGGTAGTVWAGTGSILQDLGLISAYAGQNGVVGQTTPVPTNISISGITTGGGVGAGTNGATPQNGGNIVGGGIVPTISGGTSASTTTVNGSGGYMSSIPSVSGLAYRQLIFTGGAGGASSNAGAGGDGGNGAYGCGGGGGGAGVTNLGGAGGRGGDGLVIITCW